MRKNISFPISTEESIIIEINDLLESLTCCYFTPIYLLKNNKKYYISEDDLLDNLYILKKKLQKTLKDKLEIHDTIKNNKIGLIHTQYKFCTINEIDNTSISIHDEWLGERYHIWGDGFSKNFTLWLYNKNKEIVLEITPTFTDDYFLENETPNFKAYEKFIKNYKPLLKRIIPKSTAQQWLEKTNNTIQIIENNIKLLT